MKKGNIGLIVKEKGKIWENQRKRIENELRNYIDKENFWLNVICDQPLINRKTIGNMRKGKRVVKAWYSDVLENTILIEILNYQNREDLSLYFNILQKKLSFPTFIYWQSFSPSLLFLFFFYFSRTPLYSLRKNLSPFYSFLFLRFTSFSCFFYKF